MPLFNINKLSSKEIEEQLPQIDGITKPIAEKVAKYADGKIKSGKKAFDTKDELMNVLKQSGLNSRYTVGVGNLIDIDVAMGVGVDVVMSGWKLDWMKNFSVEIAPEFPNMLKKFKKPDDLEIIKPDSNIRQVQPVADDILSQQLCKINNLPDRRAEPIRVYNGFEYEIKPEDFNGNLPLGYTDRMDMSGIDFAEAIKRYAETYGENRFFYRKTNAFISQIFNSEIGYSFQEIQEYLINKGVNLLLYSNDSLAPSIANFRMNYLGWNNGLSFNTGSIYSLEEIDNAIRSNAQMLAEIVAKLRKDLNDKKTILEGERDDLNINNQSDNVQRYEIVVDVIGKLQGAVQDEKEQLTWHKVRYFYNGGSTDKGDQIKHNDTFPLDYLNSKMAPDTEIIDDELAYIFTNLQKVQAKFTFYETSFGPTWNIKGGKYRYNGQEYQIASYKVRKVFMDFLYKLKAFLDTKLEAENNTLLQENLSQKSGLNAQISSLVQGISMLDAGVVSESIISRGVEYLSTAIEVKKYVSDIIPRAVVTKDVYANNMLLVQPPENRLNNLFSYVPKVGMISEYSLEVLHQKFGFGKHLYSQSLFPGEEVSIEMSSKSKKEVQLTTNSSEKIFEEANTETSTDFNKELNNEFNKTTDSKKQNNESFGLNASASADWGWGSASISASYSKASESSSAVNEAVKNVSNTTDKLAKKLSDQRQVTFEKTTSETSTYTYEDENKTSRKFVNINKERTLTFNFFQITREYKNTLLLDDIYLHYNSGKFELAAIFVNTEISKLADNEYTRNIQGLNDFLRKIEKETSQTIVQLITSKIIRSMPPDLKDHFDKNSVFVLYRIPYSETVPLSQANAFLANTFAYNSKSIKDINNLIWKFIGNGSLSPGGIGVAAFPYSRTDYNASGQSWPTTQGEPSPSAKLFSSDQEVVADKIKVTDGDKTHEIKLPNLDLCYSKVRHFRTKYVSEDSQRVTLPMVVHNKIYVINTNGVYCENMLGSCGALEDFATTHRALDVKAKEFEVKKAELLLPPNVTNYTNGDGIIDFDKYGKVVEQYEKVVKAINGTAETANQNTN